MSEDSESHFTITFGRTGRVVKKRAGGGSDDEMGGAGPASGSKRSVKDRLGTINVDRKPMEDEMSHDSFKRQRIEDNQGSHRRNSSNDPSLEYGDLRLILMQKNVSSEFQNDDPPTNIDLRDKLSSKSSLPRAHRRRSYSPNATLGKRRSMSETRDNYVGRGHNMLDERSYEGERQNRREVRGAYHAERQSIREPRGAYSGEKQGMGDPRDSYVERRRMQERRDNYVIRPSVREPRGSYNTHRGSMREPRYNVNVERRSLQEHRDRYNIDRRSMREPRDSYNVGIRSAREPRDYNVGRQSIRQPRDYSAERKRIRERRDYSAERRSIRDPRRAYSAERRSLQDPIDSYHTVRRSNSIERQSIRNPRGIQEKSLRGPRDNYTSGRRSSREPRDPSSAERQSIREPRDSYRGEKQSMREPRDFCNGGKTVALEGARNDYDHREIGNLGPGSRVGSNLPAAGHSSIPYTLDNRRGRSKFREVSSSMSPERNAEDQQRTAPIRTYDDVISNTYGINTVPSPHRTARSAAHTQPGINALPRLFATPAPVSVPFHQSRGVLPRVPNHVPQGPQSTTIDHFLRSLGLEEYSNNFKKEEVDFYALRQMSDPELKELGIPMGPRKRILHELKNLSGVLRP